MKITVVRKFIRACDGRLEFNIEINGLIGVKSVAKEISEATGIKEDRVKEILKRNFKGYYDGLGLLGISIDINDKSSEEIKAEIKRKTEELKNRVMHVIKELNEEIEKVNTVSEWIIKDYKIAELEI